MCEIFALNSEKRIEINSYLKKFFEHSLVHCHGWGLSCHTNGGLMFHKEALSAQKSAYLKGRLRFPVVESNVLAHIRYATVGRISPENAHPFILKDICGTDYSFIHNGTLHLSAKLDKYVFNQKGSTDSERFSMMMIDELNRACLKNGGKPDAVDRFVLFERLIAEFAPGNKLNLLFSDGEYTYVHTNVENGLYVLEKDDAVFFSTLPLTKEAWKNVPCTKLLAYKNGSLAIEGREHDNIYLLSEEEQMFVDRSREILVS